jgi:hypothetical protein
VTAGAADFVAEPGGFERPRALLTPAGDGHVLDERALGGGFGPVLLEVGGEEFVEFLLRFPGRTMRFRP